jgi:hypothetical protein
MKKSILTSLFLALMAWSLTTYSQDYKTAFGFRLGPSSGVSVKHFISEKALLEGILARRWRGFNLTGLYEINNEIVSVQGMNWYYGGGVHIGSWQGGKGHKWFKEDRLYNVLGLDGIIGLEYNFAEAPINISLDYKPSFNLLGYMGIWGDEGAVSIRYIFK